MVVMLMLDATASNWLLQDPALSAIGFKAHSSCIAKKMRKGSSGYLPMSDQCKTPCVFPGVLSADQVHHESLLCLGIGAQYRKVEVEFWLRDSADI